MAPEQAHHSPCPPPDDHCIRCPRLGHQVNFSYCLAESTTGPCFKTLDCWYSHFDVHAHLKERLSEEAFNRTFLTPAKPKILSLLDLIEQARQRQEKKD